MSNTPAPLTSFQQRAQLRLQEKETEWRRTLFERFRHICREEMMDVMKTLLETMHTPQALTQKLEELHRSGQTTQEEMQRLCEEVKRLTTQAPPSAEAVTETLRETGAKQEMLVRQTLMQQEKIALLIQDSARESTETMSHAAKSAARKSALLTALVTMMLCAAALAGLKFIGGMTLASPEEMNARQETLRQLAEEEAALRSLLVQKRMAEQELAGLKTRQQEAQAELLKITETQKASMEAITQLQQIQEQFRFKLARGEKGGVFAEIEPGAKPFEYQGATFIQVK